MIWLVLAALLAVRLTLAVRLHRQFKRRGNVQTMVVLGSGGHTAEMLALLRGFDLSTYTPRCYVVAATDKMSGPKAVAFEGEVAAAGGGALEPRDDHQQQQNGQSLRRSPRKQLQQPAVHPPAHLLSAAPAHTPPPKPRRRQQLTPKQQQKKKKKKIGFSVVVIPRSREVGQSFRSSVRTTLHALWHALRTVFSIRPDLLVTNGPGTALPLCAAAVLARALGIAACRVVYVESIARVYRLSLTGKILYRLRMADEFVVQWEELAAAHPRATFAGRLM